MSFWKSFYNEELFSQASKTFHERKNGTEFESILFYFPLVKAEE